MRYLSSRTCVIRPNLVLRSWVSFKRLASGQAMIMGDLVLTDDEINPVISALQQGGVEQTALHNHLVSGSPTTMNLHIGAQGPEVELARAIRRALEITKTPLDTGDCRRLRDDRGGGEPGHPRAARERDRYHGAAQPHDR